MGERGTPRLTPDQVISILRRHGFRRIASKTSHQKWFHSAAGRQVIVPYHSGCILPLGAIRAIIEGSCIPASEWN